MAHDVFISYSSKDKAIADAACATLEAHKVRCWIAPRDVTPGVPFARCIIDGINESRIMVLVFSTNSNDSQHVLREVDRAASRGMPIVPFRIDAAQPGPDIEYLLGNVHWLDAMTPPLEARLSELAGIVMRLLGWPEQAARPQVAADGGAAVSPEPYVAPGARMSQPSATGKWNPVNWLLSRKGEAIPRRKMAWNVLISMVLVSIMFAAWWWAVYYMGSGQQVNGNVDPAAIFTQAWIVLIIPLIISWGATYPARQGMIRWKGILVSILLLLPGFIAGFCLIVLALVVWLLIFVPPA